MPAARAKRRAVKARQDAYEDVILEEARRAMRTQVASLDELRSRAGLLLAAAAVTGSFLGSQAADQGSDFGCAGWLAVVAFGVAFVSCLLVLWPQFAAWTTVTSPKTLADDWLDTDRPDQSMKRFLAESIEEHYDKNDEKMGHLFVFCRVAVVAVGAEVILGISQLALR